MFVRIAACLAVVAVLLPQRAMAQSPAVAALSEAAAMQELALASRILANEGVLDAYGHVSIRHPADPNRYLMARSRAPALITPADILAFDLDFKSGDADRPAAVHRTLHPRLDLSRRGPT